MLLGLASSISIKQNFLLLESQTAKSQRSLSRIQYSEAIKSGLFTPQNDDAIIETWLGAAFKAGERCSFSFNEIPSPILSKSIRAVDSFANSFASNLNLLNPFLSFPYRILIKHVWILYQ